MRGIAIAVIALSALTACFVARVAINQQSGHASLSCTSCHVSDTQESNPLRSPEPGICAGCHQERAAAGEHAVGVRPKAPASKLPLRDGLVQCSTCHDPHGNISHPSMLRLPQRELCSACHDK